MFIVLLLSDIGLDLSLGLGFGILAFDLDVLELEAVGLDVLLRYLTPLAIYFKS